MENNLIMFSSVTLAIRSRDLLRENGIDARMVRTPSGLRKRSCGYSLLVVNEFSKALNILGSNGIAVLGTAAVDFR